MKIAFLDKIISPEIGVRLAGYGSNDVSRELLDDLYMNCLALDDGHTKALIVSFDLLGMDEKYLQTIRHKFAQALNIADSAVILSCTHTHCGPHLRSNWSTRIETSYLQKLYEIVDQAAQELARAEYREVDFYYGSKNCPLNRNRRIIGGDNRCSFFPKSRDLLPLADGICDRELGMLFFVDPTCHRLPLYMIGNFAAHPLAGHGPGLGGLRISADYPGVFRHYIQAETATNCMFLSGMAGDMIPIGDELGLEAMRTEGIKLAQETLDGYLTSVRQPERFKIKNPTLHSTIVRSKFKVREHRRAAAPAGYIQPDGTLEMEVQLLAIGDICLVGVPGEVLAELGLEIKWHSPFRRTFLLYNSTGYFDYLCHGNALVSGGYEGFEQLVDSRSGLKLVQMAIDGAYELFEQSVAPEKHPDCQQLPLTAFKINEP